MSFLMPGFNQRAPIYLRIVSSYIGILETSHTDGHGIPFMNNVFTQV